MEAQGKFLHVLIIDKNPMVRYALQSRLQFFSELIVFAVGSVGEAIAEMIHFQPDMILLSASEHLAEQVALLQGALHHDQNAGIIILATYADKWEETTALQAGASCYLLKNIDTKQLLAKIYALTQTHVQL